MHVNLVSVAKPMSQFQTYRPFLGNAAHPRLPMAPKATVSTRLGQQTSPIPTEANLLQDMAKVVSSDEWATAQTWTKEGAIAAFNVANLLWTIREKIAFSAVFFSNLVSDPRFLAVMNRSEEGADFVKATNALSKVSQMLSLPKFMSSVRNLLDALEIRILPKFGVEVRGMRPIFRGPNYAKPNILDCTRVGREGPMVAKEILDFGDLCNSSAVTDLEALQVATRTAEEIAPEIRVGMPALGNPIPLIVSFVIGVAAVVGGTILVGKMVALPAIDKVAAIADKFLANPAILDLIKEIQKTDPKKAAELFENYQKGQTVWQSLEKTAMWTAIAVGAIAVAAIVYAIVKPSSAPAAPQPLPEARANGKAAPQPLPEARGNGKREEETPKVSRLNYVN